MHDRVTPAGGGPPPHSLEELNAPKHTRTDAWLANLVLPDLSGGRFRVRDLDAIAQQPTATALRISGLDQRTFETLVHRFGQQFTAMELWKCPRIEDLGPLEALPHLTHVSIFWNQRTSRLWDMSKTPKLRGLEFLDFRRLRDLDDLCAASTLEELSFGNAVWVKAVVSSIAPLAALTSLRRLSFAVQKIEDGRIQPLATLAQLDRLEFPTNLFTTEQLAWLRARLPETVQGRVLGPVEYLDEALDFGPDDSRDVLVMGKRKSFLNAQNDAAKIRRYVDDYWRLVARFHNDPALEPSTA